MEHVIWEANCLSTSCKVFCCEYLFLLAVSSITINHYLFLNLKHVFTHIAFHQKLKIWMQKRITVDNLFILWDRKYRLIHLNFYLYLLPYHFIFPWFAFQRFNIQMIKSYENYSTKFTREANTMDFDLELRNENKRQKRFLNKT